jgi:DNA polymerase/3'-5' exonuclease PolX
MNSQSIATYIANLEKENADLKKRLQQCEEEKALLEYETMLQYAEVSDDESIASNDSDDDEDFFVCYNSKLTNAFDKLAYQEENEFKRAVYEKAANTIHRLDFEVKYGEQLAHLPGIGKGVIRKVNEFLETGEIKKNQTFDTNENIADQLEMLADIEEDYHKSSAYQNASETIRKLPFEVTNGTELLKIPGIGRGIANKIDEYIVTGEIKKISKHISQ